MSDDFATVNVRGKDRAREIERLRQHYRVHRDTLTRLATDAPSEHLAREYEQLVSDIDSSLGKLEEAEGRSTAASSGVAVPAAGVPSAHSTPAARPHGDPLRGAAEPGARPLVGATAYEAERPTVQEDLYDARGSKVRIAAIVIAGVIVLAAIAWLIWGASSDRDAVTPIVESTQTPAAPLTETETATIEPASALPRPTAPAATGLTVRPELADFGTVRKGTSATRQIEVTNTGNTPLSINVSRSKCRCLYYEYTEALAPGKKETITVRLDGARAKSGTVREKIQISSKTGRSAAGSFEVAATIR